MKPTGTRFYSYHNLKTQLKKRIAMGDVVKPTAYIAAVVRRDKNLSDGVIRVFMKIGGGQDELIRRLCNDLTGGANARS